MKRKPKRATLATGPALLLSNGIGLLVRHASDDAHELDGTVASALCGLDVPAVASATRDRAPRRRTDPSTRRSSTAW